MESPRVIAQFYDALAREYDAQLARNPVALEMRAQLHRHLARVFQAGDRVVDITAGTGADARFLAGRGVRVTALDASPGMIAELEHAAARAGLVIEARVLAAERLGELDARALDGAISTFAGLNTIDDLPRLARDLAVLLKPRGRVILHALNSFCLWQWARHARRGERAHTRRTEIYQGERHRFYNPSELSRKYFARDFYLQEMYALSVIAAPPLVKRFPRMAPVLFAVDRAAGRAFPAAGDFFVMELVRRDDVA